ncbi:MAG TPA: hypothetical protein VFJ97_06060 [Dermatophilaceae bacterium]|nr:hypothetical protein [Dermatophilaceae bacterium]
MWTASSGCVPLPGALTLLEIAGGLAAVGGTGTGHTIPGWTQEVNRGCTLRHDAIYPSWADLAMLRDRFGWSFVSAGQDHLNISKLTVAQQWQESCGSLSALAQHGHNRAWGLFAPRDNATTRQIQTEVVATCFAYGRKYRTTSNLQGEMAVPWFQGTLSVNGGACRDPALPCYSIPTRHRYLGRADLARAMRPAAGQWSAVQVYHLVRDSLLTGDPRSHWDCTSPNPDAHWTGRTELYCWNDYLAALQQIPTGTVITDPATVATAWGRTPPFS